MTSWIFGLFRRRLDLGRRRIETAEADIFADGGVEQEAVLEHDADLAPERFQRCAADVDPVEGDLAGMRLIEPHQEAKDRALADPLGPTMAMDASAGSDRLTSRRFGVFSRRNRRGRS